MYCQMRPQVWTVSKMPDENLREVRAVLHLDERDSETVPDLREAEEEEIQDDDL